MSNDLLIDNLVGDLRPVRGRNPLRQAAILAGLAAIELVGFLALGTIRPDFGAALSNPAFWWKLGGLGILAVIGVTVALGSFAPVSSPRRGLRGWAAAAFALVLTGWVIDFGAAGSQSLVDRLTWRMGLECLTVMTLLSIAPVVALGLMMRNGAPTDQRGSSLAVGAGAATWGAFIFAFHCPSDDPFYIVVWYTLGCAITVALARAILPRLTRW